MADEQITPQKEIGAKTKADIGKRLIAALVDMGIVFFIMIILSIFMVIPVVGLLLFFIGGLVCTAYMLFRDGIKWQFMDNRSLGKKLLKLRPVTLDGSPVDLMISIKRNFVLAIPILLISIPIFGWIPGSIIGTIVLIIEIILIVTDPEGQRMGDKMAKTKVVEVTE